LSLFNELKRRHVFKVGIGYIVLAWVVMQVADVVLNNIAAPTWVFHVLLLFLACGFPLAIFFAWAFELTPDGLKRENKVDSDSALLESNTPTTPKQFPSQQQEIASSDKSIAVLPFINMSDDESNEYFSDGISEELLNLLSKIPQLRVAARTSSFSLKGKEMQVSEVGEVLKVDHVLEGSVRKAGNQVRITAQLVKAGDGYHLWSESYDRTLDDIFAIQDEIAVSVVEQLKVTLLGKPPSVEETDPEAYSLYLQARELFRQGTSKAWDQSVALFRQSLAIAPAYAATWAGLANVYIEQSHKALLPVDEGFSLAREAANKAIAINPGHADAHASLGDIAVSHDLNLLLAARHAEKALALEPANPGILRKSSYVAAALNRLDESIRLLEYAIVRDPVNSICHARLGVFYMFAGQLDKAIDALRTSLQLSPGRMGAHYGIGVAQLLKGDTEAALASMQLEADAQSNWELNGFALVYHVMGEQEASTASLEKLIEQMAQGAAANIAYIYAFRGENDRAFEWLDKAVQYKDPGLAELVVHPLFASIYSDPRWLPFLESIGRAPEQLAAIDFRVTLPR
jgi:TolB-like protein